MFWDGQGLNPIKHASTYSPSVPYGRVSINRQRLHQLGRDARSPTNRACCCHNRHIRGFHGYMRYINPRFTLLFFTVTRNSPFLPIAVAITIASTHYTPTGWAWLRSKTVTHLSTNPAQRTASSLMQPTMLPLSQTANCLSLTKYERDENRLQSYMTC